MSRILAPEGPLIRKQPTGAAAQESLRREREILQRLSGVTGVVQLAEASAETGDLLVRDVVGGAPLAGRATPMRPSELVSLGRDLAWVVAAIHQRGVLHRDLNPTNIVISDHGAPYVIDFSLATTVAEIRPDFTPYSRITGTLPYLAPEQTGRTGRPVDQRADLYALGAVLYELATGGPPFGTGDPLRLIHDHLATAPTPPDQANPAIPSYLSRIILRLLEKEPDNRYQGAEGLLYDLRHVSGHAPVRVGEHDYPRRLRSPSRLIGRDTEIAALGDAFAAALAGDCQGLLISGPAGVGKTSLVNELRPVATASDGWYVAGKFDQYRRDHDYDAVRQALRTLGRLLLAEPEAELTSLGGRIRRTVGPNTDLVAAILPEFATLLQLEPAPHTVGGNIDPLTNQGRLHRTGVDLLRAVASPERPLVVFIDDLQWATRTPLGLIDQVLTDAIPGLLLICAYREEEIDPSHVLAPALARWQHSRAVTHLRLANLTPPDQAEMVTDILRIKPHQATDLATAIARHTNGNPYDTIELLNALRHDDILTVTEQGWAWNPRTLRQRLGQRMDLADVLEGRVRAMPPATRELLETMACLGGRVDTSLLSVATESTPATLEHRLGPALDDGLLVLHGHDTVRFRHDRVREAILQHLGERQPRIRVLLARRLTKGPDLSAVAAQQYLPIVDTLTDTPERRTAARLLQQAAEQARLLSDHTLVERLLAAAAPLMDPTDTAALVRVHTGRHAALYSLGRQTEADDIYHTIEQLTTDPLDRVEAAVTQISALTDRGQPDRSLRLGEELLRQLGVAVPAPDHIEAEIEDGIAVAYRWSHALRDDDVRRPELAEPRLLALASLIDRMQPAAYFSNQKVFDWLTLTALRMWAEHGPTRALVTPLGRMSSVLIARRGDYRTPRKLIQHVIAVGEAHSYEPAISGAGYNYALNVGHWFEPLEETVARARRAREELIRGGEQQSACYCDYVSVPQSFEYTPTLDSYVEEVDGALSFATRTGNDSAADAYRLYRQLADRLRATADPGSVSPDTMTDNPTAVANLHVTRALVAALFGDEAGLDEHTCAAMRELRFIRGAYPAVLAYLLRALALADQIRTTPTGADNGRNRVRTELDEITDWFAARAEDGPHNLSHLLHLVEAECAWAAGDFGAAVHRFDAALREVTGKQRPWHRAFIHERAARFYLAHGVEYAGHQLLSEAREAYQSWGATAKVNHLDWAYADLTGVRVPGPDRSRPVSLGAGTIDLMAILAASRALSSQTTIAGLRSRLADLLTAMTGATDIHLLVRERGAWQLAPAEDASPRAVGGTPRPPVPMSAVRYTERTRQPLVVADATRDDRFATDPYLADLDRCALLAVPITTRDQLTAMLLLENRLLPGAFTTERLDAVTLIAAQLAVSLDNAQLYTTLEQRVDERTHQLTLANEQLARLSATDPLTGLPNRRRLEEVLNLEFRRARDSRQPMALAMIDIDHFKHYNDHYGHTTGDRCLQTIATALQQAVRGNDLVTRYGGEEFAVIMPDADPDVALTIARRLHAAITNLATPHPHTPSGIVTISIGLSTTTSPAPGQRPEQLLERADRELYQAKRHGRNRISAARDQR